MAEASLCNIGNMQDNLYREESTGDLLLIIGGNIVNRWKTTGIASLTDNEVRGDILRYEASAWNNHAAKASGQIVGGDGTDVKSMPVTGQVALTHNAGNLEAAIAITNQARGDLIRREASAWARLSAKTSGQLVSGDGNDVISAPMTGEVTVVASGGNLVATMGGMKAAGNQCVGHLDSVGVGSDTETVTIGTRAYELDTHDAPGVITSGNVRVDVSGGSTVKSQGTLNLNSQPLNGETVTIDGKVYTFEDELTDVDGHVHISHADASHTIDNLIGAINLVVGESTGAGVDYAATTTIHPTVSAAIGAGDTMIATAKAGGVGGDAIATLDGLSDVLSVWDDVTLGTTTAGVSPTATEVAAALAAAINADASRVVDVIDNLDGTLLLVGKAAGATNHALAESTANVAISAAACVGGAAAAVKVVHAMKRTITAADVTTLTDANGVIAVAAVPLASAPTMFTAEVRTSAGVLKPCAHVAFSWVQANTNWFVLKATDSNAGSTDLANTDIVTILVIE